MDFVFSPWDSDLTLVAELILKKLREWCSPEAGKSPGIFTDDMIVYVENHKKNWQKH